MNLLDINNLEVNIGGKQILTSLNLTLQESELLGLIGPNGAGKSTLMRCIAQLQSYSGRITMQGERLSTMVARERAQRIGYLDQGDRLRWPISVRDLVALGRHPHRDRWRFGSAAFGFDDELAIREALKAADVWELRDRRMDELSGGERARARLARVLAVQATLLLVDEPVAALDPLHQLRVMNLLRQQCRFGGTVVVVMHDLTLASRFCDRLLLLENGQEIASGSVREVLTKQNLRRVYGISAVVGEHREERFVIPWECDPKANQQTG